jgi:hypothetical protein
MKKHSSLADCMNRLVFVVLILTMTFSGCVIDNEDAPLDLTPPQLVKPAIGQLMDNGCVINRVTINWDFEWAQKKGAARYHFRLRAQNALLNAVDNENITSNRYRHVINGYIGSSSTQNWTWQVRAYIRGNWTEWSTGTFNVKEVDTGC